jgi:hypothetical protein
LLDPSPREGMKLVGRFRGELLAAYLRQG